jgi:hypothetical protein
MHTKLVAGKPEGKKSVGSPRSIHGRIHGSIHGRMILVFISKK